MKDTLITAKRKKTELLTILTCFIISVLVNVYSIISYNTSWAEVFTSIGYVLIFTAVLYVLWTTIRFIFRGVKSLVRKK